MKTEFVLKKNILKNLENLLNLVMNSYVQCNIVCVNFLKKIPQRYCIYDSRHDITNQMDVRQAKTKISPVWDAQADLSLCCTLGACPG